MIWHFVTVSLELVLVEVNNRQIQDAVVRQRDADAATASTPDSSTYTETCYISLF